MSDGVLRIEVHYKRGKLKSLENEYHTDDPLEILWTLIQESQSRILNLVEKCYPDLKDLSIGNAQELILASKLGSETKNRMLILLEQMQRKQTIDAAFSWMDKQGISTKLLMKSFEKTGIHPIPLRTGFAASYMPSLVEILRSAGENTVCIELNEIKYK